MLIWAVFAQNLCLVGIYTKETVSETSLDQMLCDFMNKENNYPKCNETFIVFTDLIMSW